MNVAAHVVFYAMFWCAWLTDSEGQAVRMLPASVALSGVVTDASGTPLGDVSIDHPGSRSGILKTDPQGRFEITTRAPAVVFRKSGFQSRYLRLGEVKSVGLSIRLDGPSPEARECGMQPSCSSLKYFGSAFCLPKMRPVRSVRSSEYLRERLC